MAETTGMYSGQETIERKPFLERLKADKKHFEKKLAEIDEIIKLVESSLVYQDLIERLEKLGRIW